MYIKHLGYRLTLFGFYYCTDYFIGVAWWPYPHVVVGLNPAPTLHTHSFLLWVLRFAPAIHSVTLIDVSKLPVVYDCVTGCALYRPGIRARPQPSVAWMGSKPPATTISS